jgi:hypothetical protein
MSFLLKQGLLVAFEGLMPDLGHKYCVRYLHANIKSKGFKGKKFKDALWGAARAPNEIQFKYYIFVFMDQRTFNYVEEVDPRMWSRHAFRVSSCSDILLNNISESFNAWMLEAREKLILTCLEMIRQQLMNRFNQKRVGAATSKIVICPKIMKKLERNKVDVRKYICQWSNNL